MKRSKNAPALGLSRKGKKFIASNPRLFTISDNERQRLLSARVANILENSCKFEDYGVHLTQEKTIFPDIPQRLKVLREEVSIYMWEAIGLVMYVERISCETLLLEMSETFNDLQESPLWRRASLPFEVEEEEEYLRKLTNSNQIKTLELPCLRKSIEKTEVQSDVGSCDRALDVTKVEESAFDNSGSIFASDKNNATFTDEIMDSSPEESSSTSSISKKFFPIFGSSQGNKRETGNFGSQANTSGMDDFETPKPKSKFSLWGSKKEKFAVKKSFSHEWKPPPISKSDHKDLAQDLLALFLEKTDADVTVYGREEKPIRAHKLILKARCPKLLTDIVIDNNAKSERKREVIPLTCFSHTAVKCLMCFIYCGRLLPTGFKIESLSPRDLEEIIQLGQKYGIDLTPNCTESEGDVQKQTKESFCQTVATENEEKYIQTDDGEIEREEFLNDARVDERSFQYHSKSMDFNHSYNNDSQSPDLFEDSFNDKVFANKLGDSITRKRRRTRSERSFKMSDDSDSDCIVILDNEDGHDSEKTTERCTNNTGYVSRSPLSKSRLHNSTDTPHRNTSPQNHELFPGEPTWSRSCDDTFFANLPADEDLLNMPPTSPTGYGRASPILPTSPISIIPSISVSSPESKQPRKVSAKKQTRKKSDEHQKKCKRGKPRGRAKIDDNYFQFDSDEEDAMNPSLCSEGDSTTKPARKRATPSASQGTSTINRQSQSNPAQTPMLNYSLIDTPILKKELKRYGLKPLPRSKAKILLRHIYTETHK